MGRFLRACGVVLIVILSLTAGIESARAGENGMSNHLLASNQCSSPMITQSEMSLMIEQEFSDEDFECTSEKYVAELARSSKDKRTFSGVINLLSGSILIALAMSSEEEGYGRKSNSKTYGTALGLGAIGIGVIQLAVPSKAEKDYKIMQSMSNLEEREQYGAASLEFMSRTSRGKRIVGGIFTLLLGVVFVTVQPIDNEDNTESDWNFYLGAACGIDALISLAVKSKAETTYGKYLKVKEQREIGLYLGPDGRGGGRIGITYSF